MYFILQGKVAALFNTRTPKWVIFDPYRNKM